MQHLNNNGGHLGAGHGIPWHKLAVGPHEIAQLRRPVDRLYMDDLISVGKYLCCTNPHRGQAKHHSRCKQRAKDLLRFFHAEPSCIVTVDCGITPAVLCNYFTTFSGSQQLFSALFPHFSEKNHTPRQFAAGCGFWSIRRARQARCRRRHRR